MLPSYQANDDFDLDDTEPSSVKRMLLRENLGGSTSPLNQFWSRLKSPSTRQIAAFACLPAFLCLLGLQRLFGHHSSGTYPQFGKPVDWSGRENYPLRVNWRNRTNQLLTPFKTLTEDQCDNLFQPLYGEIDRARDYWKAQGGISRESMDGAARLSNAHLILYENQLYVKGFQPGLFSRAHAQVALINEAISTSPEPLPNIEFAISINDWAHNEPFPLWELCREDFVQHVWLQPDYGFYSWPEPGVGSFQEIMYKTKKHEEDGSGWLGKQTKLFWKGAFWVNPMRQALADAVADKKWADIENMDWGDHPADTRKTIEDHCDFKYLAHVEGGSSSGRLKFIQMCRSVIVTHELRFIQHFHHLINSNESSPDQNTVVVLGGNWNELPAVMDNLLANEKRATKIADNSYEFWRYWNSPAATSCYVRKMIRNWAEVQKFTPVLNIDDAAYNSFDLMRTAKWDIH